MELPSPVLLITDRLRVGRSPLDVTRAALGAGCGWISLREKDLSPGERIDILEELLALTRPAGATLCVRSAPKRSIGLPPRRGCRCWR